MELRIDTTTKAPHPTTLSASQITTLRDSIDFADDVTKSQAWAIVRQVIDYLLSDKSFLQNSTDEMDISSAKAELPSSNTTRANPYSWANVIDNVLSRLEPIKPKGGTKRKREISVRGGMLPAQRRRLNEEPINELQRLREELRQKIKNTYHSLLESTGLPDNAVRKIVYQNFPKHDVDETFIRMGLLSRD